MTDVRNPDASAAPAPPGAPDEVDFVSGRTRVYGIVGDPIEQVRSPEMITAEFVRRGIDALMIPVHVRPADFDGCLAQLKRVQNLDGLVFTIPYKRAAVALADDIGVHARTIGAINALARRPKGRWAGDIFDGMCCVEAFRPRCYEVRGQRLMLLGAGGAGAAIGVAMAHEHPGSMRLYDIDAQRAAELAASIRTIDPAIDVEVGVPVTTGIDILLNASPVGMLTDPRMPVDISAIEPRVIVFDAIVKPEPTKLLALAQARGCRTVFGREMMRGQISKIVDFFTAPATGAA
jgi:shikimate dehydrogenase